MTSGSVGRDVRIDWYFDFISPFSYLQFAAHPDLMSRADVTLRPVVFAGLLKHWGHKGPAEIPEKRRQTFRHLVWQTEKRGIPFRCPPAHPFNPVPILRLAVALGATVPVTRAIFEFVWREGRSPVDEWEALCGRLALPDAETRVAAPAVKDALRANGDGALAAGVYGVPTFVVHDAERPGSIELFWGEDMTPMLREYLANPRLFATDEMRRVEAMPAQAVRRGLA